MQEEFERAQDLSIKTNQDITVVSRITVKPPQKDDEHFGQVSYSVSCQRPPRKSIDHVTELRDGIIVADGASKEELLQEELNLEFPDITRKPDEREVNVNE